MIKKIEVHRYSLRSRSLLAAKMDQRAGALLRVTFSDLESPGVSDLFPWRDFGDPSLETWFEELRQAWKSDRHDFSALKSTGSDETEISPTLRLALVAAHDEALAISQNRPLVSGSVVNHWLATDATSMGIGDIIEARQSTSPAIKIKIGRHDPLEEAAALGRLVGHWGIRLRLDANERLSREGLLRFVDALPILIRQSIEFIEDPFQFDLASWSTFHRETGLSLAYDRGASERTLGPALHADSNTSLAEVFESGAAQVLIHKPAWQDEARAIFARERRIPIVVTSILGHPVGNLWAASKAFELAPEGVHGCKSHIVYRDDEASTALVRSKQVRGSRVVGLGVGLGLQSKWWSRLKWEPLV